MINKANYYAVIPATILFDNDLSPIEKIVFAHISVLSEKDWYCFASNWYLWEQIGRTPCNVSKILSKIQKKWYISIFQDGTKRLIYLEIGVVKNDKGVCQKWQGGVVENDKHNIEEFNIKNYYLWKNQKIEETKRRLDSVLIDEQSNDGLLKVTLTANRLVKSIEFDPTLLDDKEQLEDYLVLVMNKAIAKATSVNETELAAVAKDGMPNIPGMDLFK